MKATSLLFILFTMVLTTTGCYSNPTNSSGSSSNGQSTPTPSRTDRY